MELCLVYSASGACVRLRCTRDDTIAELKRRVCAVFSGTVHPVQQRWVYRRRALLQDHERLMDYDYCFRGLDVIHIRLHILLRDRHVVSRVLWKSEQRFRVWLDDRIRCPWLPD